MHIDHALAHRLEMADTSGARRSGQAVVKAHPEMGASTEDIAGGCAIFAGVGSPITQAIGLGMNGPVTDDDMTRLEAFFESRGARVEVECCPFSHPTLREQFDRRGYRVLEWSNVLCQRISAEAPEAEQPAEGLLVRQAAPEEAELWCSLLCLGFADEMGDATFTLMPAGRALFGAASAGFLAFVDGQAAGGGVIWLSDGVAGVMGASTLPAFRRRGAQSALLRARLDFARRQGCDLAYTITAAGSGSQRNVERAGFRVAYTRTKLYKPA
jgi:GNAT superfamily N-acetyltransferase